MREESSYLSLPTFINVQWALFLAKGNVFRYSPRRCSREKRLLLYFYTKSCHDGATGPFHVLTAIIHIRPQNLSPFRDRGSRITYSRNSWVQWSKSLFFGVRKTWFEPTSATSWLWTYEATITSFSLNDLICKIGWGSSECRRHMVFVCLFFYLFYLSLETYSFCNGAVISALRN